MSSVYIHGLNGTRPPGWRVTPPGQPSVPDLVARLEEAGRTLLMLPPDKVPGRMHITNDGTSGNGRRGTYEVTTFVGRDAAALDRQRVSRVGTVRDWPRLDLHVWCLVHAALAACGYDGRGRRRADLRDQVNALSTRGAQ